MPALPLPDPPLGDAVITLRGFESRDVPAVTGWAFDELGLERVELRAQCDNHASQTVAARAGFVAVDAPLVRRPECDHLPDVFFARLRGDG